MVNSNEQFAVLTDLQSKTIFFILPTVLLVGYSELISISAFLQFSGLEINAEKFSRLLIAILSLVVLFSVRKKQFKLGSFYIFLLVGSFLLSAMVFFHQEYNPKAMGILYLFAFYSMIFAWMSVTSPSNVAQNVPRALHLYLWTTLVSAILMREIPFFQTLFFDLYKTRLPGPILNPNNLEFLGHY